MFFLFFCKISFAQKNAAWLPLKIISADATDFTTDNLGNIYFITNNNRLLKYDLQSDTILNYNNIRYGNLASVDASNPLRLLLFYPDAGTIIMLDRLLAFQNKIDLRNQRFFKVDAIAAANDNHIWIYDEQEAKLKKIDDEGNTILESVDLRQVVNAVPAPDIILDRDGFVYVCDPEKGIFVFDQYATYKNQLPFTHVESLQLFHGQLFFFHDKIFSVYNLQTFQQQSIPLPDADNILNVRIERNRLYILRKKELDIYALP